MERKYRVIEWSVSETGRKIAGKSNFLRFFFRQGSAVAVTPFMTDYAEVVKALKERQEMMKTLGKGGSLVLDIESNIDDTEKYEY
jgi:hypothetical protein